MLELTFVKPRSETPEVVLVLLHAFPLSSSMWAEPVKHLSSLISNLPIALVDFPGFGSSDHPEDWTMDSFAKWLEKKLDHEAIRKILLAGCSMGGYAALAFYRSFPERVAALIFSNTKASADSEDARMDREIFAKDTETRGAAAVIDRMLPKFLTGESEIDQVSRESQLREWIEPADPMALATALRAMAARQDSRDILKQISIPTLVIAGESDPLIALDEMRSMASSIPNAQFNLMEKTGHLAPVDQSEQWAKLVVAFIEKTL